jgi:hypothetical protein
MNAGRISCVPLMVVATLMIAMVGSVGDPAVGQVRAAKPQLPPGRDPGGAVVGLVTTGVDPTRLEVGRCLARDGEGGLLGWDMVDRDQRPYRFVDPRGVDDTGLFAGLACDGRLRVSPVRIDPTDGLTLAKALTFFSTTPVRVVVVPRGSQPLDWEPFKAAAAQFTRLVVLLGGDGISPGAAGGQMGGHAGGLAMLADLSGNVVGLANEIVMTRAVRLLGCTSPEVAARLSGEGLAARLRLPECQ